MNSQQEQLIKGVREEVIASKLEKTLRDTVDRLKRVQAVKSSKAELEVAIILAENTLKTIEDVRKL